VVVNALANLRATFRGLSLVQARADILPGVNIQLTCFRGLDDAQCDVLCCRACHRFDCFADTELCAECNQDMADMRAGIEREERE
jgi:hypothetical protein